MRTLNLLPFVRHLKETVVRNSDARFIFFLGAGCSITSNIPGAADLVRREWLPRLKKRETGFDTGAYEWAKRELEGYSEENSALFYGEVMERLLLNPEERQREIERIVMGRDPAFGYAVLAQLMGHDSFGHNFNVVLTTNFDDLVADALYLYTAKKPLVIHHESLAGFVRVTRTVPLVIKLHGDAQLAPKNLADETAALPDAFLDTLRSLLGETGLVFLGYGGNDKSIAKMLEGLPEHSVRFGVYWVRTGVPGDSLTAWLKQRKAVWVKHTDFDELMLHFFNEFGLAHPSEDRLSRVIQSYRKTFEELSAGIEKRPEEESAEAREALVAAKKAEKSWWAVDLEASEFKKSDPDKADRIYAEGIKQFPKSPELLVNYASFLKGFRKDHDRAEEYLKLALEADPKNAWGLANYALFLEQTRREHDRAEEYYKRALEADPKAAWILVNYANFLKDIRKEHDRAEEYYKRALEADPKDAWILGIYANFLKDIRKDYDRAEEYLDRALEADPKNAWGLANYAIFLKDIRKDHDRAEEYFERALEADPKYTRGLANYAIFLSMIRKDHDGAEECFKRALEADPKDAWILGIYANFLKTIRKDYDRTEEYFKRALEADPKRAWILGSCAGFLLGRGREEGWEYLEKAFALAGTYREPDVLRLECWFYRYAHSKDEKVRKESLTRIEELLDTGVRSPGWDLSLNVERAIADGFAHPDFLRELTKVIVEEADLKELDGLWPKYGAGTKTSHKRRRAGK
jgi:Tfp pilus assembly protein PilF